MKKESKENKPNIAQALSDKKNILYENNLLGISNAEALLNAVHCMVAHLTAIRETKYITSTRKMC